MPPIPSIIRGLFVIGFFMLFKLMETFSYFAAWCGDNDFLNENAGL